MKKYLLTSKTVSVLGTTFFNAIMDLWVIKNFGSAEILGNTIAFSTLAASICSFIGGYIADSRFRYTFLMIVNFLSSIVCMLSLINKSIFYRTPFVVYITVFLLNIGSYLSSPLFKTITSLIVNKKEIVSFNKLITALAQVLSIFIPPIATFMFQKSYINISGALLLNAISYMLCVICLLPLKKCSISKKIKKNGYIETLKMIRVNKILLFFSITGFVLNFFLSGINVWLPFFTVKIVRNAALYGICESAQAIGGILGTLSIRYFVLNSNLHLERIGIMFCSIILIVLTKFPEPIILILVIFLISLVLARYNIALQSLIQINVSTSFIGKTFSVTYLVSNLALPIASFLFGKMLTISWKLLLIVVSLGFLSINILWLVFKSNYKEYFIE